MSEFDTPTNQKTLPVELSMQVLEKLSELEVLCKTTVSTSAKVLAMTRELLDVYKDLQARIEKAERRLEDFPCQRQAC